MDGEAAYGLWLNQKGKVVADSFVVRQRENGFLVGSYHADSVNIHERLEAFIIADDVTLQDETADWGGITFFSEISYGDLTGLLPGGIVFRGRRGIEPHWEWLAPKARWISARAGFATATELSKSEMEMRRITAAIPSIPQDIGVSELPNEGGLDRDAVSYTKGCYLGQEVMARLKAMGQVRRRLVKVEGSVPLPSLPATLFTGDRQIGELRSATETVDGFAGLALVTTMHVPKDRKVALCAGGSATIELQLPV